jgi:hypothetical protein
VRRLLRIVFFFEVGFVLTIVPWSTYWDRNYFADVLPALQAVITNNFIRGAVTGLGLVNVWMGVAELASVFIARRDDSPPLSIGRSARLDDQV